MKKFTKLLSVFLIAGAVGTGVAGISACGNNEKEPEHTHTADTTWHTDADKHWHECTEGDGAKLDEAAHKDENSDGKCDVCDYTIEAPHEHVAGTEWKSDENKHWHECTAGDGAKLDEAAHVYTDDQDATCNTCGYERTITPAPVEGFVVAENTTGLQVEGVETTYNLSTTLTSATVDLSTIKVYLDNQGEKGIEVPAENYTVELYDGTTKLTEMSGLKKNGTYTLLVTLVDAKKPDGSAVVADSIYKQLTITVNNAYTTLALKSGTTTQVQGADIITSTWAFEATRANGDKEDILAANVEIGTVDTNAVGEKKVTVTLKGTSVTVDVTYTITADATKVSQSYVLSVGNWTAAQKAAIPASSDADPVVIDEVFTVVAGLGEVATGNTEGNGLFFNARLKFGGKSDAKELNKQRYIKVTAAEAGTLTVYAYSNTGTAPADGAAPTVCTTRKVAVYGSRVPADGTTKSVYGNQVGTSQDTCEKYISIHTFDLPAAGEYYIIAEGGDICFTYVKLDMLRTAGEGIEKVDAPAGTDEIAKLTVSTSTENYKQAFTLGDTFSVSSEYTVKAVIANNITGVVASEGAITDGITYWLGETQLIPGTSTLDVLGENTITVKAGNVSATYTVVVNSAVEGVTGINATDNLESKQVLAADGTIALTKANIVIEILGTSTEATVDSYVVKVDGTELTDSVDLAVGTHTIEVTATVSAGGASTDLTDTFEIVVTVKPAEGTLSNVNVDSTIVSASLGDLTAETVLVDNASGKVFITAAADKKVTIDASAKSYGDKNFTHRIKLGGTGSVAARTIGIEVKQGATIVVYAMSSSGTASRDVQLLNADGSVATATATLDGGAMGQVDGAAIHKVEYTVTEAGTYYFGSVASGLNVYGVEIIYA